MMQPIRKCPDGVIRFKENKIVRTLLDRSQSLGFGLNNLGMMDFSQADWEQFYQLIGYSIVGYHELSNVSDVSAKAASKAAKVLFSEFEGGCRDGGCDIHCGVKREGEAK